MEPIQKTKDDDARPRKVTTFYGANTPVGGLNALSKTTWWEIKGKVMNAAKEVLLDCLSPKHHDQWEFAAHKCFQLGLKKVSKRRKSDDNSYLDDSRHSELLRQVARLYIVSKQDGVPREQLHAICAVVNTTVSMDDWNDLLKDVQREIGIEKQHAAAGVAEEVAAPHLLVDVSGAEAMGRDGSGSNNSGSLEIATVPPPSALHPAEEQQLRADHHSAPATAPAPPPAAPIRVSWRAWLLSKEPAVAANASVSRRQDREWERRCKSYDSNKAISTAIRLVEGDSDQCHSSLASAEGGKRRRCDGVEEADVSSTRETTHGGKVKKTHSDPMSLVIQNRLGYQSAALFASKLDIMQKIIRSFREAENTDEKDFLLGLISGSFTRDEVNRVVVPPEAQLMLPGRVRNTALISGHKWTSIRKAAGCVGMNPRLDPERYAEGVRKRRRTIEERRLQAATGGSASGGADPDMASIASLGTSHVVMEPVMGSNIATQHILPIDPPSVTISQSTATI